MSTTVLVLYYSLYGNTTQLSEIIATGVESVDGASAVIRTVPAISANTEATEAAIPEQGAPYATPQDLSDCDALALGSPTHFGNMAAPMKYFWDNTAELWQSGGLVDKPGAVFTSTASMHGGHETTLISMMLPLLHHGMIITGCPYTTPELTDTLSGGTPYGPSHLAGPDLNLPISKDEKAIAHALGKRLAGLAIKLKHN